MVKEFGNIVKVQRTFPQWRGFELAPQGHLLEQVVDLRGQMGLAYERMVDFRKDFHIHDRLSFVFPRGACVMQITSGGNGGTHVLGPSLLLVIPAGQRHAIAARSSIFDAMALYPTMHLLNHVAREHSVTEPTLTRFRKTVRTLPRTPWLDQLLLEYFSRRVLALGAGDRGARLGFFEKEITREVLRIAGLWRAPRSADNRALGAGSNVSELALQYIEANLFASMHLDSIAKHAHASVSTLLRRFAERTGISPLQYVRNRRLDEARALLKDGTHSVAKVAFLVGYENPGAFCEAFHSKFGQAPSRLRAKRSHRPPHL